MNKAFLLTSIGLFLGVAACGDSGTTAGAGGGTTTTGSGGATTTSVGGASSTGGASSAGGGTTTSAGGATGQSGDCDTDADCISGTCEETTPGGFRVCVTPPVEAVACAEANFDECCTTADCEKGKCFASPVVPFCGGVQPIDHNVCAEDQCAADSDCGADAFCPAIPMLGRKVRACIAASCRTDDDCSAEAGGVCAPVTNPCCGAAAGLFCVYPSDGCRTDADCPDGYCQPDVDRASCQAGTPTCPA